jgi:lipoate-protein ligase A
MVNGRKISGGAQRRNGKAVLQHGTVIVDRDEDRMARLFRTDPDTIRARVTSLSGEGVQVSREKLVEALVAGFRAALGPDLG